MYVFFIFIERVCVCAWVFIIGIGI